MTTEIAIFVRVSESLAPTVKRLRQQGDEALRRSSKLLPGDRTELQRFEALQAAIERCAMVSLWGGEPHWAGADGERAAGVWISAGGEVVELRLPHAPGETALTGTPGAGPPPPRQTWRSESATPREAMRERFHQQVSAALSPDTAEDAVLRPSGVTNSVLTETLREFVQRKENEAPVAVSVRYLDGSNGPAFPLRAIALTLEPPPPGWRRLRFTLLSIRHVEMDNEVDGAWLRNAKVSQRRPAGQTDDLVYDTSLRQLRALTAKGPVLLEMYQTGLETAIVGFYRAVTRHLIDHPGTLAVAPRYYRRPGHFDKGTLWATV